MVEGQILNFQKKKKNTINFLFVLPKKKSGREKISGVKTRSEISDELERRQLINK